MNIPAHMILEKAMLNFCEQLQCPQKGAENLEKQAINLSKGWRKGLAVRYL